MFIARQPIFNKSMKIYGYELLFRSDINALQYGNTSSLSATASVFGSLFEQGIDKIIDNEKAFVNFDYDFIMSDAIELIDPNILIIELLETIKVDEHLINRIEYLKKSGYKIALDDFVDNIETYPIVPIADIIKYDILATPLDTIREDVKHALSQKKVILAEKIETEEEFQKALEMGFHLFQGYFFSKPKIIGKSNMRVTCKTQYYRIINELKKEEPSFNIIARIIESNASLAYRIMRVVSNKKGESTLDSITTALLRMGFIELERWINVLMLQEFSREKPVELMKLSLVRSKFGEFIAENSIFKNRKEEISMMCLFSLIDVILDMSMVDALDGMMITQEIFDALVYAEGKFKPICTLISSYERGDWANVSVCADCILLDTQYLSEGYLDSIQWAATISESLE